MVISGNEIGGATKMDQDGVRFGKTENTEEIDPVSQSSRTFLVSLVEDEVKQIVDSGELLEEEFRDEDKEPIKITRQSNKTLKFVAGLMEAMYGASDTPVFPVSMLPHIDYDEMKVTFLDYEIMEFEQPVTYENVSKLSKIINVRVKFRVPWGDDERMESLIIKVPPDDHAERELAEMARADRREIYCYNRIFLLMQQWSIEQNVEVMFGIPKCYFAKINRNFDTRPVRNVEDNIPEAESILVLQDLRPHGFGKRHFIEGLMIDEVKAAICEIGKIHAISYVMQQKTNTHLTTFFAPLHKPLEVALLYDVLLEDGFLALKKFLAISTNIQIRGLVPKVQTLESGIRGILTSLLEPHPAPYPTCLTHNDFWCDNIVFRRRDAWDDYWTIEDAELDDVPSPSSGVGLEKALGRSPSIINITEESSRIIRDSPLECRILDWQMVSFGRPTHDIALLLIASLPTDVRKKYTYYFLRYYYQVFKSTVSIFGGEIYFDLHWLHKEYRRSRLLALLFIITSAELALADPTTQDRLVDVLLELSADGQI